MGERLSKAGYARLTAVLDGASRSPLELEFESLGSRPGRRDGLRLPAVDACAREVAEHPTIVESVGEPATCVRAILFDKGGVSGNWKVAPHRDLFVPLAERSSDPRFGAWSRKDGVWHAAAPEESLARMVSLRVCLDPLDPGSGGLEVWPGSHSVPESEPASDGAEAWDWGRAVQAEAGLQPGDGLLLRPRLVHASRAATSGERRRILHLEFGPAPGCCGAAWHAVTPGP